MTHTADEIARAIIDHGHAYVTGWYDDGDVESGPRGGAIYGFRWGQVYVTLLDSGDEAIVFSHKATDGPWGPGTGYPLIWAHTCAPDILLELNTLRLLREAAR